MLEGIEVMLSPLLWSTLCLLVFALVLFKAAQEKASANRGEYNFRGLAYAVAGLVFWAGFVVWVEIAFAVLLPAHATMRGIVSVVVMGLLYIPCVWLSVKLAVYWAEKRPQLGTT